MSVHFKPLTLQERSSYTLEADALYTEVVAILEHELEHAQSTVLARVPDVEVGVCRNLDKTMGRVSRHGGQQRTNRDREKVQRRPTETGSLSEARKRLSVALPSRWKPNYVPSSAFTT